MSALAISYIQTLQRARPAWGWRIPFVLSLWLGIFETPVFAKLAAERRVERAPILEVIKCHPKEIVLSAFV